MSSVPPNIQRELDVARKTVRIKSNRKVRKFNLAEAIKPMLGRRRRSQFTVEEVKEKALSRVLHDNFCGLNEEGLELLVKSINSSSTLHAYGKSLIKDQIILKLSWLLGLDLIYKKFPEINSHKIDAPVFIVGLARSGTTALHGMMAKDSRFRWMPAWEATNPLPHPASKQRENDPRLLQAKHFYDQLKKDAPEYLKMHFVAYDEPDECFHLLQSSFLDGAWWWLTGAWDYLAWAGLQDHTSVYELHKKYLKVMTAMHSSKHWLLKCPSHLGKIQTIKKVYPDARFVHIHRDPIKSLSSGASLSSALRKDYVKSINYAQVGAEVARANSQVVMRYLAMRDEVAKQDIIDVYFKDLISSPVSMIKQIYEHFEFDGGNNIEGWVDSYLKENPRGKYGSHHHALSQYGLIEIEEREKYEEYMSRFNVPRERL